jgi:H+/gluconate symporter-like permease
MLEVCGIFLSIAMLIFFAYRGFSVLILSPLVAILAVFVGSKEPLLASYTQIFMSKLGNFVTVYFPLFFLSAIFGKIMEMTGYAKSIANGISEKIGAENAILAVILSCGVLTYGGVSLFVVAFVVYPIAVELFERSCTPKRLIPGAIAVGSFTFTMVSLPGSPAIQNAIPSQYFGTNTFAAPGIGIICSVLMFAIGIMWLKYQLKLAKANGEGYGGYGDKVNSKSYDKLPNFWLAIAPIFVVILLNYGCVKFILPSMDTSYLQSEKYGQIAIETVAGNWAVIIAVFFAIMFLIVANLGKFDAIKCINAGAVDSLSPIFNTASVVGYGAVINSLPGFAIIRDFMLGISNGNPIISSAFITGVLGGITGSASGGLSISLEMMGAKYLEMATSIGINPEALHRIISIASASLNTLPHNGAVITLFAICGLTHKDSYKDIFVVALIGPFIATIVAILLYIAFGSF